MKQAISLLLCALLLACPLSACGSGSDASTSESASSTGGGAASDTVMEEMGWDTGTAAGTASDSAGSTPLGQAKIIRTAALEMETQSFDDAVAALDRLVEELGGYCENRSIRQHSAYRSASFTVRVPAASFDAFLDQAGQAAHVTWQDESQDDVGESYYDIEARLATQRTKRDRLQALLEQAATMADIIELENALSDTELEIEYLTGSLRQYDSLIDYATITISLQEVYRLSNQEEPALSFPQRLGAAFSTGLRRGAEGLEELVILAASNWVMILAAAGAAAAVTLLLRRRRRRKAPPPAPPAGPDSPIPGP